MLEIPEQIELNDAKSNSKSFVDLSNYNQSWYDRGRPSWFVLLWWFVQAFTFPLTLHHMSSIRCKILRLFGARIGKDVLIRPTARFTYPWRISIGDNSWVGDDVVLYSLDQINIGNNCVVSQKSYLCTGTHDIRDRAFGLKTAPINIEDGAWVASDCFVSPGVKIGANAVVGARSSVLTDIPNAKVSWGTPCRPRYDREMN
ncbi:MAG: hormogonium polysaccharide biosynthesis acetyltransferase HpsU [Mastigocoleus sp.]